MERLKLAIQKSGRLNNGTLELLKKCGINFTIAENKLVSSSNNFPLDILFLRDDDIPHLVIDNSVDIGIVGGNVVEEATYNFEITQKLGFAKCRLSLAIPRIEKYTDISYFNTKTIATSYPNLLKKYLAKKNVEATIQQLNGSVEIAPGIGIADAICDIVSTGSTLLMNGLKEVETVFTSEAILIGNTLSAEKKLILDKFLFRIQSVKNADANKYVLLNAPNEKINEITAILPGIKSPTILPLATSGWSSLHSVISEDDFWSSIDQLKQAGAQGILIVPIEKMVI